ncbi:MAG: leucyl aminopeptidase family protein [Chitinophagaceae bacterium]|nr:MAG: leucyl aminopeptidase family protein [Chitinophagaceae bacterium]
MLKQIKKEKLFSNKLTIILTDDNFKLNSLIKEKKALASFNKDNTFNIINLESSLVLIVKPIKKSNNTDFAQTLRLCGNECFRFIKTLQIKEITLSSAENIAFEDLLYFTEGFALSTYTFNNYKSKKETTVNLPISIYHTNIDEKKLNELNTKVESTFLARDWVNRPLIDLTAEEFSNSIKENLSKVKVSVKILRKKELEKLKMGGLLSVNKGSQDPPTFNILEWKPANAVNKKPIILVGKGLVYDTGGLSLKQTANSMDMMKSDMAGGAVVAAGIYAIAKEKLPVYTIGLIPATDNRPGENAITPGDVIKMFDGTSVEVLNTDAEGRLILADALSYAKKYKPMLVLDFATLTGSAKMALGPFASVTMGNAPLDLKLAFAESSKIAGEKVWEFPFFDEYKDLLKSDMADLKNVGGPDAGAITAGKFLEHFTDYPYIHNDIAGTSFLLKELNYMGKNGTGFGVRLIYEFVKMFSNLKK